MHKEKNLENALRGMNASLYCSFSYWSALTLGGWQTAIWLLASLKGEQTQAPKVLVQNTHHINTIITSDAYESLPSP